MDDQDFLTMAEKLLETLDEDISDRAYSKASEFFDGVKERTESMANRVRDGAPVTKEMSVALENMVAGVNKWIR